MGEACGTNGGEKETPRWFWWGNVNYGHHTENAGEFGRILKLIFEKRAGRA